MTDLSACLPVATETRPDQTRTDQTRPEADVCHGEDEGRGSIGLRIGHRNAQLLLLGPVPVGIRLAPIALLFLLPSFLLRPLLQRSVVLSSQVSTFPLAPLPPRHFTASAMLYHHSRHHYLFPSQPSH